MLENELREFLISKGVSDVGYAFIEDSGCTELKYAVSIVVRLSDAIVAEITDEPTATYFNHYRTVNAFIDRCLLDAGLFLQERGYKYITVAASQSMPGTPYNGRFSHKKAARLAGLGDIGKNSLFIHKDYGTRVRLGTLFTDCELTGEGEFTEKLCSDCDACVKACPSGAISGNEFFPGVKREDIFEAKLCSDYMKKQFHHIGRGVVCGICMKVCPYSKR